MQFGPNPRGSERTYLAFLQKACQVTTSHTIGISPDEPPALDQLQPGQRLLLTTTRCTPPSVRGTSESCHSTKRTSVDALRNVRFQPANLQQGLRPGLRQLLPETTTTAQSPNPPGNVPSRDSTGSSPRENRLSDAFGQQRSTGAFLDSLEKAHNAVKP